MTGASVEGKTRARPRVCIALVNWNLKQVTLECLESLRGLKYPNFQVVVVDNGSQDGSPEAIADRFPEAAQVVYPENLGSTAGFNAGFLYALAAGADYAFLINNDTILDPDALDILVDACENPEVGIASPLIFYAGAPEKIWSAGAMLSRLTLDLIGNHGRGEKFGKITRRDFLTGCAMLVKREVLEPVGVMDRDFFLYYEDMDYCFRVRKEGYHLIVAPKARMWHKVSLSGGGSGSLTETYWMARNVILYYRKHARGWQWFFIVPWRAGAIIKKSVRLIAMRKWAHLREYWRGLRDGVAAAASWRRGSSRP